MTGALSVVLLAAGCFLLAGAVQPLAADLDVRISAGAADVLAFEPRAVVVPADAVVQVTFGNLSSSESHNLTFLAPISVQSRTIVEAGTSDVVVLRAPGAGVYTFVCTIHPEMSGTLVVR